ncbi:MAG: plasmid mobilization protein [Lachnospiraceae bacterium]
MSGVHKNPTISFRISEREREEIEAKIIVSGLNKKDYFVRSCIYNHVCVVGKKELIYKLVRELRMMMETLQDVTKQFEQSEVFLSKDGLEDMRLEYLNLLKAMIWMLDGAKYLWQDNKENVHTKE